MLPSVEDTGSGKGGCGMAGQRVESRAMKKLREVFLEEGRELAADPTTEDLAVCWLCGDPIDYTAEPGTTPDSHNLDHFYPVSDYPELQEDPDNFRHAHASCNQSRGDGKRGREVNLGEQVPPWW